MVIVGNFGGSSQLDYRALGDAINTASRLEGANKYLGTRVCVSGATARRCPGFTGRPIGLLKLKGKTKTIEAFEPLPSDAANAPSTRDYLLSYRLLEQNDDGAEQAFALLTRQYPDDDLVSFQLQRLRAGERGTTIVLRAK
jgi:adenylate cyclase